jgi:signal transduction histidine kinase/HAMP domain-containing protein
MDLELTLLSTSPNIKLSLGLFGWLGWLFLLISTLFLWFAQIAADNKRPRKSTLRFRGIIFLILIFLILPASTSLVVRLPPGNALPPAGVPIDIQGPALILLAAVPMFIAAGMLNAIAVALIGASTGLIVSLWETHSLFTILVYLLLALIVYAGLQQRYRTRTYSALRTPWITAICLSCLYPTINIFVNAFTEQGELASRLDYAITHVKFESLAGAGEILIAGVLSSIIAWAAPRIWGNSAPLEPSPVEKRLPTRFLVNMAPLAFILVTILIVGDWVVAGRSAKEMIHSQMQSSADLAAQAVPFFLETGQSLIQQISQDSRWFNTPLNEQEDLLKKSLRAVPYFSQLLLIDNHEKLIAYFPNSETNLLASPPEELIGIKLALTGVPFQNYTIAPAGSESAARVTFLAAINDKNGGPILGVIVARTDIATNPFTQPIISGLDNMSSLGGTGILLDSENQILYHSDYTDLMERYQGLIFQKPTFYEDQGPDGTNQILYFTPTVGHPWSIVMSVPLSQSQQTALRLAAPILVAILVLFVISGFVLQYGLRVVTASLDNLAQEANRIAGGEMNRSLAVFGEDEVGQLRKAFEQMRQGLKARMDELNRLLAVSQGVASSLNIEEAVKPVLDSALVSGACSVRIVLVPNILPEIEGNTQQPLHFGAGPSSVLYGRLDEQMLTLMRQQHRIVLNTLTRVRSISIPVGVPRPEALLSIALRHDNTYYGVVWLVYDQPHTFNDEEIRFMSTLASQMELAISNARLYLNAEIGRQRLAGILASTADPVLVTDHQNRLLLTNPAAWQIFAFSAEASLGQPLEKSIQQQELIQLMRSSTSEKQSAEVLLPDGRIYLAMASSVLVDTRQVGRVCVLRDVTYFKELDALKSEFVATVSHDLRSPLTLLKGYTTMLEMMGQLNEQQTNYVRKIALGIESMSRLVSNLLDLGRIEAGMSLQFEIVSVRDVIERATATMQLQAVQKQIQLTAEVDPGTVPLVEADQGLFQQALQNLIDNSIKYTDPGGKIRVLARTHEENLVVEVIDNGIGVAPVDQPRLFEKFYRGGQRDARKQQGSGLGLAIVKSIIERHKGKVWFESQLGKGSKFSILLPIRQD